jgi:hypothetical protein
MVIFVRNLDDENLTTNLPLPEGYEHKEKGIILPNNSEVNVAYQDYNVVQTQIGSRSVTIVTSVAGSPQGEFIKWANETIRGDEKESRVDTKNP